MEPSRTVEFAMRFAAALSAWWLLAAVPLVVLIGVVFYRRQSRSIGQGHAWGLTALRAVMLAFVVLLGASAPFSPVLFEHGVDAISGTRVVGVPAVRQAVGQGATFRQIPGK